MSAYAESCKRRRYIACEALFKCRSIYCLSINANDMISLVLSIIFIALCYSKQVQSNSTTTLDSGPYPCPAWDNEVWMPFTRNPTRTFSPIPPGKYVPEQLGGQNIKFLIWCNVNVRANNRTVVDQAYHPQITTFEECISQCVAANRADGEYGKICTAVSFKAAGECVLKSGSFVPDGVNPNVTLTAEGNGTAILLPAGYDADSTWNKSRFMKRG